MANINKAKFPELNISLDDGNQIDVNDIVSIEPTRMWLEVNPVDGEKTFTPIKDMRGKKVNKPWELEDTAGNFLGVAQYVYVCQ